MTFNQHGNAMLARIASLAIECRENSSDAAGRDLALARTHLEDALTRFNSACYRMHGSWKRADPEVQLWSAES